MSDSLEGYRVASDTLYLDVKIGDADARQFVFEKSELAEAEESLSGYQIQGSSLFTDRIYEVLVNRISSSYNQKLYGKILIPDDTGRTFELSDLSNDYFWVYISDIIKNNGTLNILQNLKYFTYEVQNFEDRSIISLIKEYTSIPTIKIVNATKISLDKFGDLANSFSYLLAFHLKGSFRVIDKLSTSREQIYQLPNRTIDPALLSGPKKKYDSILTGYYSKMISSSDVSSQFLSLYHVLEHEFDKIITSDTIKYVSDHIKSTGFSYNNPDSIENLIKEIVKRVKISPDEDEDFAPGKELNALRLVVSRYIGSKANLSKLLGREWIKYYGDNGVQFCTAKKIDLSKDDDEIFPEIAQRIYTVRNSIVHSKSKNSNRFVPFRDEQALTKELPLLQVIAEQIIENTAGDL